MKCYLKNKYNKIYIANDHAGIELKQYLIKYLQKYYDVVDLGTNEINKSVDYPDFGFKLAQKVNEDINCLGIAICGSGNGINIACNKNICIRSAILYNTKAAIYAKKHNDANIIVFSARFINKYKNKRYLKKFLSVSFEGNRHQNRIDKIKELELKSFKDK